MMESHLMIKNSIVLVSFPFDDSSSSKVRPALCLTSEIGKYNHIIIAFISSKIPDDLNDSDLIIREKSQESIGTGLTVDSVIRLHKIVTIPKSLIKRRLGKINQAVEEEIKVKILQLFEN
jgi:mRNA interferase MazF